MTVIRGLRFPMLLLVVAASVLLAGCASIKMRPMPNQERIALSAEDVVTILATAGFRDDDIVKYGREFRNQLARHGAVSLRRDGMTIVMAAVRGSMVHVTSLTLGSFVYDPGSGTVR